MRNKIAKIEETNKELFLGIDVHDKTWSTTILTGHVEQRKSFTAGAKILSNYMKKNYPDYTIKAAYEAGCFGYAIQRELESLGINTIVVNPADIPQSDKNRRNKTDKADSRSIAYCLRSKMIKGIYIPTEAQEDARALMRHRAGLTTKMTRIKNQIKALLKLKSISYKEEFPKAQSHWSKKFISWLEKLEMTTPECKIKLHSNLRELKFYKEERTLIMKEIKKLSQSEPFKEGYKILTSVPGIGIVTAMSYLTEIMDINRFESADKYISYLGLSPNEHSSGEKHRIGHMTKRCNHALRSYLIESSWIARRLDPELQDYYNKISMNIGSSKSIIKVARKLALRMRSILKSGEKYKKSRNNKEKDKNKKKSKTAKKKQDSADK